MSHGQATRSTLIFSRVIHFMSLQFCFVAAWFWYAVVAAVLYGAHQIFTRLAADRIGEGLGGFVVEASAALSILIYLAILWFAGRWNQKFSGAGFNYSLLTGVCVGAGTIVFSSFSKRRTALFVPAILAGGAAIMAIAGILFFHEPPSWQRIIGVVAFAIIGLFLLRK